MELVDFLRARLTEDEQTARRAGDSFRQIGETGVIVATEGDRAEECASAYWAGIAEHIVRHDPARVLHDIEARQQILSLHGGDLREQPMFCGHCEHETPCPTLCLLAAVYADHPDYQETWRP